MPIERAPERLPIVTASGTTIAARRVLPASLLVASLMTGCGVVGESSSVPALELSPGPFRRVARAEGILEAVDSTPLTVPMTVPRGLTVAWIAEDAPPLRVDPDAAPVCGKNGERSSKKVLFGPLKWSRCAVKRFVVPAGESSRPGSRWLPGTQGSCRKSSTILAPTRS